MQDNSDCAPVYNSKINNISLISILFLWFLLVCVSVFSPIWDQFYYMKFVYILGSGIILLLFLTVRKVLIPLCTISFKMAIGNLKNQQKKDLYTKDTEEWFDRVFYKKRPNLIKIFAILLILVSLLFICVLFLKMSWFLAIFPSLNYDEVNTVFFIIVTTMALIAHTFLTFYFLIKNTVIFFGVSNILHHFTFWEYHIEEKENNIMYKVFGKLIIVDMFFFILQFSILGSIFIGIILTGMIFVISPINPHYNYARNPSNLIKWQMRIIPLMLTGSLIISAFLHYFTHFYFIAYINQVILTILFVLTWHNFIHGKGFLPLNFSFDAKIFFKQIADKIRMKFQTLIIILALIPTISILINLIFIISTSGSLLFTHYVILICNVLFSMTIVALNIGLRKIQEKTRTIAYAYFKVTPDDKKIEMEYHFWETFASPQMVLFSCPFAFIFLIWAEENTIRIIFTQTFLQLNPLLSISIYFSFFLMGFSFGMVIWTFWHAVHFSWHSISLIEMKKSEVDTPNEGILNMKDLRSQFNAIIGACLPSLFYFGFGFYIMQSYQIWSYIEVYSLVIAFFLFMYKMYMKYLTEEVNRKKASNSFL